VTSLFPSLPVRITRPPARTGDERPNGTAVFQTTLDAGENPSGRFPASTVPDPFGPRNRVQPAPIADPHMKKTTSKWRIKVPTG
jgi:hypothetical protein